MKIKVIAPGNTGKPLNLSSGSVAVASAPQDISQAGEGVSAYDISLILELATKAGHCKARQSQLSKRNSHKHIEYLVRNKLYFPEHWLEEDISPPNEIAKDNAIALCKKIYDEYALFPLLITSTVEDGVYILYEHPENGHSMFFEAYNNSEIGGIVNDNNAKVMILNEGISNLDVKRIVRAYQG